jgi:hypothetical protein
MRWAGHVEPMRIKRLLVENPEGKKPLGRLRWVDNIKMDIGEIAWGRIGLH